uniref:TLC domain-containing protein n=1 Tax=viral metagenome TaxID=1070528 RepID=A0A6C0ACK4_9ZZZZ
MIIKDILIEQVINMAYILMIFGFLYLADKLILLFDTKVYYKSKTYAKLKNTISIERLEIKNIERRWYFIHTLSNLFITIKCFHDVVFVLFNPLKAVDGEFNTISIATAIALHLYHVYMCKKNMDIIDWIHHILNAFLVGFTTLFYYKGRLVNFINFFICGLPGGLDYLCLTLNKYGLMSRFVEKRINVFQNNWIRSPGILTGCVIGYINFVTNKSNHNPIVMFLLLLFNAGNCIYFAERVTINYGYYKKNKEVNKII